ncbi:MAG: hypothetical protein M3419_00525 [Actinomycetota bacterium]|nr:hypothetical protein [Actinomycetota bacterium]
MVLLGSFAAIIEAIPLLRGQLGRVGWILHGVMAPTLLPGIIAGRRLVDVLGRLLLAGGLLLRVALEVLVHRRRVEVLELPDRLVL